MSAINSLEELKKTFIDGFYNDLTINFDLDLNKLDNEKLLFYNCTFKNNIFITSFDLHDSFKTKLEFSNCNFEKKIKCNNILFEEMFVIKNTKKESSINFEFYNVEFDDTVIFKGFSINNFILNEVEFNEEAFFYNIDFENKLDFIDTYFYKSVYFDGSNITVNNRRTARIIKDSFEQQNNIIEANRFYALEMKEREKELSPFINLFEWLTFKIHGVASEHSQDWILALFWILNISFFFSYCNELLDNNLNLLLFSERCFINIIILGSVGFGIYKISKNIRGWFIFVFTTLNYLFYGFILTNDYSLYCISNNINPFSLMTGEDDLTFGLLIYKITIAYLIYQLIISIRQNTRRK